MWTDIYTLPKTNPLRRAGGLIQIAVSSSAQNELVGFGVTIEKQPPRNRKLKLKTFSITLGARAKQNPFSAELAAMAHILKMIVGIKDYRTTLLTSNKAAVLTLRNPRRHELPENIGRHTKRVDAALPGKHTRQLYDRLTWKEASVLAQLRTGMARLNRYLNQINIAETDQCDYRQARETVEHFLFRYRKWMTHRTEMLQCTQTHRGNISFFLGGKQPSDDQKRTPNLEAVQASIRFAIATGRLEAT
ncbi:Probable transposable element [Penicillium roqueforti FM164]|uniref:Probable transposable element n=1 Tax=Penicillium roqueforti (strain FM164) TaxID=1365484 RepID=W6QQ56_PENRF|nr:Probable transposable element [Penicillium roqueforti FM164]